MIISKEFLCQRCVVLVLLLLWWLTFESRSLVHGISIFSRNLSVHIVVHVRKRRARHWDRWQLNSNICPPSLCKPPDQGLRPIGTGGSVFYQGDIVLDKEVHSYLYPEVAHTRSKRATVRLHMRLWKDGVVPYEFSNTLSEQAQRVVQQAFNHIQSRTCITFRSRTTSDLDHVKFVSEPGCWSRIGRMGGMQLLSLGRGCENIGTAVHEITHSLGIWHEQARTDRDSYVKVIEENISEKFLPDFAKIDPKLSSSRGFPYDYTSVMHYSRYAFTRNGLPTLQVIGVGKSLGLLLKQREGLSTIDMAQLRDMYRCNVKSDIVATICPSGWVRYDASCYKFFGLQRKQFAGAHKTCTEEDSRLVAIETQREDEFLAKYLQNRFPEISTWRTGGKKVNGAMIWFRRDSRWTPMDYANWAANHPSTYTSAALWRDSVTNKTKWIGVWAGSENQLPAFTFPFICERRALRKCLNLQYSDARDYRGQLDHTLDGYTCQKWTEHYPHQHNLTVRKVETEDSFDLQEENKKQIVTEDRDGIGNHNFCRNPSKERRERPWCYTTKKAHEWQYCDVSVCSSETKTTTPRLPTTKSRGRKPITYRPSVTKSSTYRPPLKPTTFRPATIKPTTPRHKAAKPTIYWPATIKPTTPRHKAAKPTIYWPATIKPTTPRHKAAKPTIYWPATIKPTTPRHKAAKPTIYWPATIKPTTPRHKAAKPTIYWPATIKPTTPRHKAAKPTIYWPATIKPTTPRHKAAKPTIYWPATIKPTTPRHKAAKPVYFATHKKKNH